MMDGNKKTVGDIGFAIVPNKLAQSKNISLKAIGLYAHMDSRPEGWHFTLKNLAKNLKDGRAAITSALDELKKHGWITYEREKDLTGTYHIYKNTSSENLNEQPVQENAHSGNPSFRKPERIIKKDLTKKDLIKKESEVLKNQKIKDLLEKDIPKEHLQNYQIANMFYLLFKKNLEESGSITSTLEKSTYKGFVSPIRLMIEKDKVTLQQFRKVYDFLEHNDFWKKNILSTSKLRLQMPKLLIQANGQSNKNANVGTGAKNLTSDYLEKVKRELSGDIA